jgi:hypothetical protein
VELPNREGVLKVWIAAGLALWKNSPFSSALYEVRPVGFNFFLPGGIM